MIEEFEIDVDSLDREWLEQSVRYVKLSDALADLVFIKSELSDKVKRIQAELTLEAREGGEEVIGTKATDSTVTAWVASHDRFLKARQALLLAEHDVNVAQGRIAAMSQRKNALENLVDLWQGGYFSSPKENKNSVNMKTKVEKEKQARQRKKLNEEKK